jgi:hypothetical protein
MVAGEEDRQPEIAHGHGKHPVGTVFRRSSEITSEAADAVIPESGLGEGAKSAFPQAGTPTLQTSTPPSWFSPEGLISIKS